jgi:hypothetical protein
MTRRWVVAFAASVLGLGAVGCACSDDVFLGREDGGRLGGDGARPVGERDECGNGTDDDEDGRIDEACFCGRGQTQRCYSGPLGTVGVGACARGSQACEVTGSVEWGHWSACTGDVTPSAEACDGAVDEDCDGAVDEGCPCTEGQAAPCDVPDFVSPPCRAGTQTCRGGAWTACEGAVRPVAERCDNGIDDDCDGVVDDPHLCTCQPEPERCGDGIDNDCDGRVDPEALCACVPVPEICTNGGDDDCDGAVDEGCGTPPESVCAGDATPRLVAADVETFQEWFGRAFVAGGDLYVGSGHGDGIRRVPLRRGAGPPTVVAPTGIIVGITGDEAGMVYGVGSGLSQVNLLTRPLTGGLAAELFRGAMAVPGRETLFPYHQIALGDAVYTFATPEGEETTPPAFLRIHRATGTRTRLFTARGTHFVIAGDTVVWHERPTTSEVAWYRAPLSGGTPVRFATYITPGRTPVVVGQTVHDGSVYFATGTDRQILRAPLAGGDPTPVHTASGYTAGTLVARGDDVFFGVHYAAGYAPSDTLDVQGVWAVDVLRGAARRVVAPPAGATPRGSAIEPLLLVDGRCLVMLYASSSASTRRTRDVYVVELP